jgi:DMSO/TMAO reductase YedYZ molybdopterin-dependent catalytic subunit
MKMKDFLAALLLVSSPGTPATVQAETHESSTPPPNDQFYVRWHWAVIPTDIDIGKFSLTVRGHVNQTLSLSLNDILYGLPSVQLSAVNQCSGNSRGFFQPRVPGGEWAKWRHG